MNNNTIASLVHPVDPRKLDEGDVFLWYGKEHTVIKTLDGGNGTHVVWTDRGGDFRFNRNSPKVEVVL
jgi:hypothetical protein